MRAHFRVWAVYSAVAGACQVAALLAPAPTAPGDTTLIGEMMLVSAIAGVALAVVAGYIAWDAREWSPAMLALGCGSVGAGLVVRFVCADEGLGLESSRGAAFAPLLGLLAGSVWFFLAVQTWWPATGVRDLRQTLAVRTLLVTAASGMGLAGYLLAAFPHALPGDQLTRVFAGIAAASYVYAGARLAGVWRLVRLPSLSGLTLSCGVFTVLVIVLAAGGIPGVAPYQIDAVLLVGACLPVASLAVEQRVRPGLRSVAFGPLLCAAVATPLPQRARTITALVDRISGHGGPMRGHAARVTELSALIAAQLRLEPEQIAETAAAARLHDLGKLVVPRTLLHRGGRLSAREEAAVRTHALAGAQIAARVPALAPAARAIADHHERWDGSGFPSGKRETEIALAARIVAVADAYDILRSARAYKPEWGAAEAVSEIERGSGSLFEPRVVQALVRLVASGAIRPPSAAPLAGAIRRRPAA
ncbi:MAG: HD domain-containing protein [Chloroflexi bacterium]|nr:HD domain-containing protein [Chloroflexota bacterium]